jgi:hypothetical protein
MDVVAEQLCGVSLVLVPRGAFVLWAVAFCNGTGLQISVSACDVGTIDGKWIVPQHISLPRLEIITSGHRFAADVPVNVLAGVAPAEQVKAGTAVSVEKSLRALVGATSTLFCAAEIEVCLGAVWIFTQSSVSVMSVQKVDRASHRCTSPIHGTASLVIDI